MQRIEQVEDPLDCFASGEFYAGIAGNGNHRQHRKQLDGNADTKYGNRYRVHHPVHQQYANHLQAQLVKERKHSDDANTPAAIVALTELRHHCKGDYQQRFQPLLLRLLHTKQHHSTQSHCGARMQCMKPYR